MNYFKQKEVYVTTYFMSMKKQRLLKPTLFLLVSIPMMLLALFEWITSGGEAEGWGAMTLFLLLPFAAIMLVSDVLLKIFVKSLLAIWIVEGILSLGLLYYWIVI